MIDGDPVSNADENTGRKDIERRGPVVYPG